MLSLMTLLFVQPAHAIPRFAARNGADCQLCHVNPSGGGMRNEYGRNVYAAHVLPWLKKDGEARTTVSPSWSPTEGTWLALGADTRTAFLFVDTDYVVDPSTGDAFKLPELVSFFLMQADIYAAAGLSDKLTLYIDHGVASGNLEAFGLYRPGWDSDAYVKAGTFYPNYGLKFPNHRLYIREEGMGLEPNLRDSGLELGAYPGPLGISVSVLNGLGGGDGFNPDKKMAYTAKLDVKAVSAERAKITVGASGWYEPGGTIDPGTTNDTSDDTDLQTIDLRTGAYLMAAFGRLTWLGEADYRFKGDAGYQVQDSALAVTEDLTVPSLAVYNEVDLLVRQGFDLNLIYEMYDPDLDLTPNTIHRIGGGFELFPSPNSEIKVLYRHALTPDWQIAEAEPATFYSAANNSVEEFIAFLHLYL